MLYFFIYKNLFIFSIVSSLCPSGALALNIPHALKSTNYDCEVLSLDDQLHACSA